MPDEPRFEIIKLPDLLGEERRAELARQRAESRVRYRDRLLSALAELDFSEADATERAETLLDVRFGVPRDQDGSTCACSCHPRLPESDFHDYGFACSCRLSPDERREQFDAWLAESDAYWESPEGQAITAARAEEEDALRAWLTDNPDVTVTSHGGMAPEQWHGTLDGHFLPLP